MATVSTAAFAADAIVEEQALPAGFSWTGAYVGAQAGYTWGDTYHLLGGAQSASYDVDGWLAGAYVGYNYQFQNNLVVGIDADIAWSNADGGVANQPLATNVLTTDIRWNAAIRGRLGYAIDRFLPYVAGGVAFADTRAFYHYLGADGAIDGVRTGWTIGGGVEYAATDNLILRAEYRYSDFGSTTEQPFLAAAFVDQQRFDLTTHDIRVGIAYKF